MNCKSPDRHEPRLVCGYPLPCPYHSVLVVVNAKKSVVKKRKRRK